MRLLINIAGSSNGRTLGFGPKNFGSSPNPAARVSAVSWVTETGHFERNFTTRLGRPRPVPV